MAPSARPSKAFVKEEKKSDDIMETPAYSAENVQHNMRIIYYSRTFLSIVGGVVAGVLGLSAISGFLCYFIIMLLVSGGIAAKTKFDIFSYFDSWQRITVDGITAGFMSFVLFWTFAYDIVHIF
ncbi:ER membrane protein complex subunit 6 [Marchantia polymorpha subsp. ruderalis]|uniref:ER membrane protein complex subunit 6 n=1 Tax=Marchantia polymorpha TaxID=3197 RepID=A0A2R6XN52_MARPO|nr:hypothetical protein MARPO_0008s0274 [Marchantia polymorpha]BBN19306.1 hypothetical protein Mp_8g09520 [Marchantia polymorpha subsp. ruderalis]|eukprot:PTQ47533.1 hypothetical protein MARPO_0008s0274 [Marchantia polymorpha]